MSKRPISAAASHIPVSHGHLLFLAHCNSFRLPEAATSAPNVFSLRHKTARLGFSIPARILNHLETKRHTTCVTASLRKNEKIRHWISTGSISSHKHLSLSSSRSRFRPASSSSSSQLGLGCLLFLPWCVSFPRLVKHSPRFLFGIVWIRLDGRLCGFRQTVRQILLAFFLSFFPRPLETWQSANL